MEAKEFMIGDWVMDTEPTYYTQVTPAMIYEGYDWEAIPLTEDILNANGMDKFMRRGYTHEEFGLWHSYDGEEGYSKISGVDFELNLPKPILFVHELQHALRLCGLSELADNFKLE